MNFSISKEEAINAYTDYSCDKSWVGKYQRCRNLVHFKLLPVLLTVMLIVYYLMDEGKPTSLLGGVFSVFVIVKVSYVISALLMLFTSKFIKNLKVGFKKSLLKKDISSIYGDYTVEGECLVYKGNRVILSDFQVDKVNGGVVFLHEGSFALFVPTNIFNSIKW